MGYLQWQTVRAVLCIAIGIMDGFPVFGCDQFELQQECVNSGLYEGTAMNILDMLFNIVNK